MSKAENLDGIAPEQYGSRSAKVAEIQYLNTRLFYDLMRQKIIPEMRISMDLVANYDLVFHSINVHPKSQFPKEPIICTFTTIKNMTHSVRT